MRAYLYGAVSALSLVAATSASAQDDSGWYLRANSGVGVHHNAEITASAVPGGGSVGIDSTLAGVDGLESERNIAYTGGIGYDTGKNIRIEVDVDSLQTSFGAISQTPSSVGSLTTQSVMLNALYDFDLGGFGGDLLGRFEPYVGGGVGFARAKGRFTAHDFPGSANELLVNPACQGPRGFDGNGFAAASTCSISDSDDGLAWQLIGGLGVDITDNLTWDTHYTFLRASDLLLDGHIANAATGAFQNFTSEATNIGSHSVVTGLRYRFGESAPKPIPVVEAPKPTFECWDGNLVFNSGQCAAQPVQQVAPPVVIEQPQVQCWDGSLVFDAAQCPVQPTLVTCPDGSQTSDINFCAATDSTVTLGDICGERNRQEIIYYEFDKGASAETRNTVSRILDAGQFCDVENIRVVGHTDTSGAASYNLALSKRRASDALNELVRQGIDRNKITSEGKGETDPFVQTGDGVKEQLNRRTEVLITLGSTGVFSSN